MRLNDLISPINTFSTEPRHYLGKIIDEIVYNPPHPTTSYPEDQIDSGLQNFFENYYVCLDTKGNLLDESNNKEQIFISSYEEKIISFCKNPHSETRICVLHGHTGVGKSTLIRRIIYYIYPKSPFLKASFIPVYLRLPNLITSEDVPDWSILKKAIMGELINKPIYLKIMHELEGNTKNILEELNTEVKFRSRFSPRVIEEASRNIYEWIASYFSPDDREIFLQHVLLALIHEHKLKITLILDDVDRYSSKVHDAVFMALDRIATSGIAIVVSMRTSTFESTSTKILEYRDQMTELTLKEEIINQVVQQRIGILQKDISLDPEIPFRIKNYEKITGKDVVDSFCSLISRPPCMNAIVNLSNTNLKHVFKKLDLMAKSEAFSDTFIARQLLERDILLNNNSSQSKVWIFYHLLFGNYAGTFRADSTMQRAGLINLFDCSEPSQNPWRHFIKLNLLICLYRYWKDNRDEEKYLSVIELKKKFQLSFGSIVEVSLFDDAMWTLIDSELVFMGSCRRYKKDTLNEHMYSDTLKISFAGRYYLENLVHKVEYLFFMKDDINWRNEIHELNLKPAKRDYNRNIKFTDVLKALLYLTEEEYSCLGILRAHWIDNANGEDSLKCYLDNFSPNGLPGASGISICETILRNFKSFMKSRLTKGAQQSEVEILIKEIETLGEDNNGIKQAYFQT
jgi:hypothetical protein